MLDTRTGSTRMRFVLSAAIPSTQASTPPPPPHEGRSGLARRFSAFLAVALVAAGVALVDEPPTAGAQTNTNVIWSATLTIGTNVAGAGTFGCHRFASGSATCSAALTTPTFSLEGNSFTVGELWIEPGANRNRLNFSMDSSLTAQQEEDFGRLVLRVDGHDFRIAVRASSFGNGWTWDTDVVDTVPVATSLSTKSTVVVQLLEITFGTGNECEQLGGRTLVQGSGRREIRLPQRRSTAPGAETALCSATPCSSTPAATITSATACRSSPLSN